VARILSKEQLSADVYRMKLDAPAIARSRRAGQFVIIMTDDRYAERIPLTIADADEASGSISIIFQAVGGSTKELAALGEGDEIAHLLGPLGTPTHVVRLAAAGGTPGPEVSAAAPDGAEGAEGRVVCVGGGIGAAPLYPIVQAHKAAGNRVTVILGARNAGLLILEDAMRAVADEVIVCTDDGSAGRKDLVTAPLKELCSSAGVERPAEVIAIGPPVMMKFCAETTRAFGIRTIASLNTIMVDGTGMCGGCRVTVGGKTKFVCVDGPEFDAHLVDWNSMIRRLSSYKAEEAHECRLSRKAAELSARSAS